MEEGIYDGYRVDSLLGIELYGRGRLWTSDTMFLPDDHDGHMVDGYEKYLVKNTRGYIYRNPQQGLNNGGKEFCVGQTPLHFYDGANYYSKQARYAGREDLYSYSRHSGILCC